MRTKWIAGKCCIAECPMTLVMPIGAGRRICWLHALAYGLPIALAFATAACGEDFTDTRDSGRGAIVIDASAVDTVDATALDDGDPPADAAADTTAADATTADASADVAVDALDASADAFDGFVCKQPGDLCGGISASCCSMLCTIQNFMWRCQ